MAENTETLTILLADAWDDGFMAAASQDHPAYPRTRRIDNPYHEGDGWGCTTAEERLWVLSQTLGFAGVSESDMKSYVDFGAETDADRRAALDRVVRVFRDLGKYDRPQGAE